MRIDRNKKLTLCRCCGVALLTIAEEQLGVHVSCVADKIRKEKQSIPTPVYGRRPLNDPLK